MAKQKITFHCTECSYKSIKWLGCCPECKQWETLQEVIDVHAVRSGGLIGSQQSKSTGLIALSRISGKVRD